MVVLSFACEPASEVAAAIVEGIEVSAFETSRGGGRAQMTALNREIPAAADERFLGSKPALAGGWLLVVDGARAILRKWHAIPRQKEQTGIAPSPQHGDPSCAD
jgi:hypothetical protein